MEIGVVGSTVNGSVDTTFHLDNTWDTSISYFSIWASNSLGTSLWVNCLCTVLAFESTYGINEIGLWFAVSIFISRVFVWLECIFVVNFNANWILAILEFFSVTEPMSHERLIFDSIRIIINIKPFGVKFAFIVPLTLGESWSRV